MSFIIDRASVHAGDAIKMGEKAVTQQTDVQTAVGKLRNALEGLQEYSHKHTHIGRFISWLCGDKKKEATIINLIGQLEPVLKLKPEQQVTDALRDELLMGGGEEVVDVEEEVPVDQPPLVLNAQDKAEIKKKFGLDEAGLEKMLQENDGKLRSDIEAWLIKYRPVMDQFAARLKKQQE